MSDLHFRLIWVVPTETASSNWSKTKENVKTNKRRIIVLLCMRWVAAIINRVAAGDEYTSRWYIKTAITRTPSKAKNQSEWIVKLAPKNQWAIHVLDHSVSFLSMLEAKEERAFQHKQTGNALRRHAINKSVLNTLFKSISHASRVQRGLLKVN